MNSKNNLANYVIRLADSPMILGQRLTELCGHGPVLEQDIAISNIALDLLGEARNFYQYAAELLGGDTTEDSLAFLRLESQYQNHLLCELPNGDFANTVLRQFFFDTYHSFLFDELKKSSDERIAAIAEKSAKEVAYHLRYSAEWVIRLGDGTKESHSRMLKAIETIWPYTGELYTPDDLEIEIAETGIGANPAKFKDAWHAHVVDIFAQANLEVPAEGWMQEGGKKGWHSEHMGFLLSEMQMMQRTYPGLTW